jgi:hypothetical protein
MTGSDNSDRAFIIASIIAATLEKPGIISGAGEGLMNGVGGIVSGRPPGGGGSTVGDGSVGLIGPSGA